MLSGQDGTILWVAARGHDLERPIANESARCLQGVVSGVITDPTPGGDVDKDGVVDFIVCMAEAREAASDADRWIEGDFRQVGPDALADATWKAAGSRCPPD